MRWPLPFLLPLSFSALTLANPLPNQADTLVVTGTRTERALKDVPVRTELITAADVRRLHARDLNEALQYVPGLQLRPIHGKTGYGAWMQGIDANRVLILVDGNPVSASTGSAVDTTQIAVTDIEQIEIIKGAVSALYGTSAMGGVINIVTRQPTRPFSASATLSGGSWGDQNAKDFPLAQRHAKGQFAINQPRWSFSLNGDIRNQDGWKANPDSISTQGYEGSKSNLAAQWQYRFTPDLRLTLSPRIYHEDLLNQLTEFVPGIGNLPVAKKENTTTQHLGARLEQSSSTGLSWSLSGMTETFTGETQQDKPATRPVDQQRNTDITHHLLAFQASYPMGEQQLTFGGQLSEERMDVVQYKRTTTSTERLIEVDQETSSTGEIFAQNSWFVGNHLELLPGFRLHHDREIGSHLSPMINSLFYHTLDQGDRINVRFGIGKGYRVANLKERFYIFDHSHLGYKVMGNRDLQPESSISTQAGIEWLQASGARLEFSLFHNLITDLIESDLDSAESAAQNLLIYRYQNFEKARTQGAEWVVFTPLTENLRFDLGYTWMQAEDRLTGLDLPNRPEHQLKLGLSWDAPVNGLELTTKVRYESRQFTDSANTHTTPAFSVWDIKGNYTLNNHWSWFGGINNLTNIQKNFEQADNRPEEARFFYMGLRWQH